MFIMTKDQELSLAPEMTNPKFASTLTEDFYVYKIR